MNTIQEGWNKYVMLVLEPEVVAGGETLTADELFALKKIFYAGGVHMFRLFREAAKRDAKAGSAMIAGYQEELRSFVESVLRD